MERFRKIKGLKDYLQYLTLNKEYEAKKSSASLTFKKKKDEYVLQQLHEFDENVHINNVFPWFDAIHIRNNILFYDPTSV